MFCPKCGSGTPLEAEFCMKCGNKFSGEVKVTAPTTVYYWALSSMPVILGIAAIALSSVIESNLVLGTYWIFSFLINIALVTADSNELKRVGLESSVLLGILLLPVYLYRRAKLLGAPQVGIIIWLLAFTLSFIIQSFSQSNIGSMQSTEGTESSITTWLLENEYMAADVVVECPDTVLSKPGATFLCTATSSIEELLFQVTIENVSGDVTWQLVY
jgi:hypothetical protein